MIPQLSAVELASWRADPLRAVPLLVDVREPWEYEICRIAPSVLIPLGELEERHGELPRDRPLVIVCHHGNRSQYAAMMLAAEGFSPVYNLQGGVEAWAIDVDTATPRY